ncbi:hypothetical protein [Paenibacillus sp. PL2-23]
MIQQSIRKMTLYMLMMALTFTVLSNLAGPAPTASAAPAFAYGADIGWLK